MFHLIAELEEKHQLEQIWRNDDPRAAMDIYFSREGETERGWMILIF